MTPISCPICGEMMEYNWLDNASEQRNTCETCEIVEYSNAKGEIHA